MSTSSSYPWVRLTAVRLARPTLTLLQGGATTNGRALADKRRRSSALLYDADCSRPAGPR